MNSLKIKKNDKVVVLSGKDKGKLKRMNWWMIISIKTTKARWSTLKMER